MVGEGVRNERRWPRLILHILGGLAIAWLLCGGASFGLIHLLRRPPDDIRSVVEPHLPQIRSFTEATASRCDEVRGAGLAEQIAGTVPASPAQGTALGTHPDVVQVRVGCFWWRGPRPEDAMGSASGNDFLPLHDLPRPSGGSSEGTWDISRGLLQRAPSDREERATWPSFVVEDRDTVDVKVTRPLPNDAGYVEVTVTLRRT